MHVTVLGCGYVGTELAEQLGARGHDVLGVRRSQEGLAALREADIEARRADVTDPETLAALPPTDAVVFAASSGGRGAGAARAVFVEGLENTVEAYADSTSTSRLVYTSSTGVYGDHGGDWVDETTPPEPTTPKTEVLLEAERVARGAAESGMDPTVVRFAGLYGPDRYRLERYLEGPVVEGYLNMLHRADAAGVVRFVLEEAPSADLLLAVDDEPVAKPAFAAWLADQCGVDPPATETVEQRLERTESETARRRLRTSKRCSNARLHRLGYDFEYPTFREGYRAAVAAYRK